MTQAARLLYNKGIITEEAAMDNKKKTDSIMRYVVYLLCGALLVVYSLLKWNAMSEMKYIYLAIGVIWIVYGGIRALVLVRRQKQDRED